MDMLLTVLIEGVLLPVPIEGVLLPVPIWGVLVPVPTCSLFPVPTWGVLLPVPTCSLFPLRAYIKHAAQRECIFLSRYTQQSNTEMRTLPTQPFCMP
jgi:hypothetical protein